MLAVRELCPVYRTVCDDIGRLFSELTELVRRIERDGIHRDYSDDELLEAAIRRQNNRQILVRNFPDNPFRSSVEFRYICN